MTFVNAGHLPPLIYRKATGELRGRHAPRDLAGFPLGVVDGIPYEAATVTLEPGDCVLLFTDGVTEAQEQGRPRVPASTASTRALQGRPDDAARRWSSAWSPPSSSTPRGCKPHDDITVVAFGRQ